MTHHEIERLRENNTLSAAALEVTEAYFLPWKLALDLPRWIHLDGLENFISSVAVWEWGVGTRVEFDRASKCFHVRCGHRGRSFGV